MRTIKSLLILSLAVVLCSCPGNKSSQPSEQPSQQTQVQEYQYVEPDENIAQIIWEELVVEDPYIKEIINDAKKYQGYRDTKPEPQYPSKTSMVFFHVGDEFDGDINEMAFFQLQCYQKLDQSWIGVMYVYCIDQSSEYPILAGLTACSYKDGHVTDELPEINLPLDCPQSIMHYKNDYAWRDCVVNFDIRGFELNPHKFWPIRYDWTGEKFVMNPNSVVLSNDFRDGMLEPYDFSRNCNNGLNFYDFKVDNQYGIYEGETGQKVLQLTFTDSQLSDVDILSPKIGIAFAEEEVPHPIVYCRRAASKPVALGQPIKNVLEGKKDKDIYNEITESTKDGLYTLTQHLKVDKTLHKDIYAEYQAKDENSAIESFRVYTLPLVVTLESELAENTRISDETKELWRMVNSNNEVTSTIPGNFKNFWNTSENSFAAIFRADYDNGGYAEWKMQFVMFKANDGRQLAYIQTTDYSSYKAEPYTITPEWMEYIYDDGFLQKVDPQLPQPDPSEFPAYRLGDLSTTMEGGEIILRDDGFFYYAHSDAYSNFGCQAPDCGNIYYEVIYLWDGENFTKIPNDDVDVEEYDEYEEYEEYGDYEE